MTQTQRPQQYKFDTVATSSRIVIVVALWYAVSLLGIVLCKVLLSPGDSGVEPRVLSLVQTVSTALLGCVSHLNATLPGKGQASWKRPRFGDARLSRRHFAIFLCLGVLRFLTNQLGLVSLRYVAASFTETIKASSPLFTVLAAYLLLGERTSARVLVTLIPVAGGLMLTTVNEVSFSLLGFSAALATNAVESIQNVLCQQLLQGGRVNSKDIRFTPAQLQCYSALSSLGVQLLILAVGPPLTLELSPRVLALLLVSAMVYAFQTALVFQVMANYSAVTLAVLNTVKRALIIVLSAAFFGNVIMPSAAAGTAVTLCGGLWYSQTKIQQPTNKSNEVHTSANQHARQIEARAPIAPLRISSCRRRPQQIPGCRARAASRRSAVPKARARQAVMLVGVCCATWAPSSPGSSYDSLDGTLENLSSPLEEATMPSPRPSGSPWPLTRRVMAFARWRPRWRVERASQRKGERLLRSQHAHS